MRPWLGSACSGTPGWALSAERTTGCALRNPAPLVVLCGVRNRHHWLCSVGSEDGRAVPVVGPSTSVEGPPAPLFVLCGSNGNGKAKDDVMKKTRFVGSAPDRPCDSLFFEKVTRRAAMFDLN